MDANEREEREGLVEHLDRDTEKDEPRTKHYVADENNDRRGPGIIPEERTDAREDIEDVLAMLEECYIDESEDIDE